MATASQKVSPDHDSEGGIDSIRKRVGQAATGDLGLGLTYNANKLEDYFTSRPLLVVSRMLEISFAVSSCAAAAFFQTATLGAGDEKDRRLAVKLRDLFTMLGPTFVKLGQSLSVRPDILPPVFLEEFQEFQSNVAAFDHERAMEIVREQLRLSRLQDCFKEIGGKPVAAASLGQVYKAKLTDGRTVAVKVQRPDLDDKIGLDLLVFRQLAKLLNQLNFLLPEGLRGNDIVGFVDAFGQRIFEELDYENEVRNAQKFKELYGDQVRLKVPSMYPSLTTRRVIVMEWIDGVKLTDQTGIRKLGLEPLDFISIGIECSMRQLLEHGFFHADPHPGNFFATPSGDLCVLDFGMMSEMPKDARLSVIQHIVHLVNRDYVGMANDYYHLGFLSRDIDVRPIAPKLEAFFEPRLQPATVGAINFKTIVDGLGDVIFKNYPFTVPSFYALIVRSLVNLEGLALSIDRNYRVLAAAYPYVARRILLDKELRGSLVQLLFSVPTDGSDQAARFRWDRAANLLRESSKSTVAMPAGDVAAPNTPKRGDAELLMDLASSLVADPAFRHTLVVELASTADVMIADLIGNAVGNWIQGESTTPEGTQAVLSAFGLRGEDKDRVMEVRETVSLIAEKVAERIPDSVTVMQAAAGFAAEAAARVFQGPPKEEKKKEEKVPGPAMPDIPSVIASEFFGQLGERAAVRTLRAFANLIEGSVGSAETVAEGGVIDAEVVKNPDEQLARGRKAAADDKAPAKL